MIKIIVESDEFDSLFSELCIIIKREPELFKKLFNVPFNRRNFIMKILRLNFDNCATGTSKLVGRFEPTDFFRMLCSTLRAGNIDSFILKHGKFSFV